MGPELSWQGSLFDSGPIVVDRAFSTVTRLQLDDKAWVDYAPGWLSGSDELFQQLLELGEWRQRELRMYDRNVLEPRLTAGWTTRGSEVRTWSRDDLAKALSEVAREQTTDLVPGGDAGATVNLMPQPVADIARVLSARYGVEFDSVWVNLYRDGRDSVAWHGDRNARLLRDPLVVTVSLGARRSFVLRRKGTSTIVHRFSPGHGDLMVMGGSCQHTWEHAVPKTAKPVEPRMSVTIRHSV